MPEANMYMEKRVHPRVPFKIPVKYRVVEDPKEAKAVLNGKKADKSSRTINISLGGLYLVVDQVLGVGSVLRLEMNMPEIARVIPSFAEVAWSNNTEVGLRFLAMKEEDVGALKDYLQRAISGKSTTL